MAMKRLSSLMLGRLKDKDRWTGRRRSEPYGGAQEEEDEDRPRDSKLGQTSGWMLRRKSEPCGQTEGEKMKQRKKSGWKKERRKSETSIEDEDRRDRRKTEMRRLKDTRKSASWMVEDRAGGQVDRKQKDIDGKMLRRRSEPCNILYVQLLPLSSRKRRELLWRRTGRRMSCTVGETAQMDRSRDEGQMTRGRSAPIGPLDNSKQTDRGSVQGPRPSMCPTAVLLGPVVRPSQPSAVRWCTESRARAETHNNDVCIYTRYSNQFHD